MPKPVALTPALVEASSIVPRAATLARSAGKAAKVEQLPLQLRLPRDAVRAIKIAAVEREQTVSEFMLACFHACMK